MSTTFSGRKPRELNEETMEEVRKRIGIPVRYSPRNHNEVSSTDSFRHFAGPTATTTRSTATRPTPPRRRGARRSRRRCTRSSPASPGPSSTPTPSGRC